AIVGLLAGLLPARRRRAHGVLLLSLAALGAALGLTIWQWDSHASVVSGALSIDDLALTLNVALVAGGACTVLLGWRRGAEEAGHGEWHALLLSSIAGMSLLASAQNTVALFIGLELLSIPLYVLCASELRREHSLESGLKYLIVGSVGSATLLYGLAMIYGATGSTDFHAIAAALGRGGLASDPLPPTGLALCVVGQSSLKRMLAYSSVAQAGYMLAGVVVATRLGVQATVFYLLVYLAMNMASFAVIVARERDTGLGDSIAAVAGLGFERPLLAWPM